MSPFLIQAAKTGNLEIFQKILDQINESKMLDETGFIGFNKKKSQVHSNVLGCAIYHQKFEIAEFILDNLSINVNQSYEEYTDNDSLKPVTKDKLEYSKMTPLMLLAKYGDFTKYLFEKLIDKGAKIDILDAQENSILHYLVQSSAEKLFKYIKEYLKHDLKFGQRNKNGETPLSIADKIGNKKMKDFWYLHAGIVQTEDKDLLKLLEEEQKEKERLE